MWHIRTVSAETSELLHGTEDPTFRKQGGVQITPSQRQRISWLHGAQEMKLKTHHALHAISTETHAFWNVFTVCPLHLHPSILAGTAPPPGGARRKHCGCLSGRQRSSGANS